MPIAYNLTFNRKTLQDTRQHGQDLLFCYGTQLLLKSGSRHWTWTLKNLNPENHGP